MIKKSQITAITHHEDETPSRLDFVPSRLDFVMARYLALVASLPKNDKAKLECSHWEDERPTLSKWVR